MVSTAPGTVTRLLAEYGEGDAAALNRILPLVYDELRELADRALRGERRDHTLQTTALVHEAYLRLVDQNRVQWRNRAHFFGIAAQMMRRILVDYARGAQTVKRGGGEPTVALHDALVCSHERGVDLVALDEALTHLAQLDPQQARIVELRYFGGLTIEETAEVLDISPATVKRDWTMAKAWLRREISRT